MQYLVIVEQSDTGGYGAYVPDLPGCVAAAETHEEVLQLIHDAIVFHVQGLREEGMPVPVPVSRSEYVELEAV